GDQLKDASRYRICPAQGRILICVRGGARNSAQINGNRLGASRRQAHKQHRQKTRNEQAARQQHKKMAVLIHV
ncbi:MAG: hypothetical protein Q7U13_08245, partial [Rhodoferax sp.]|nr:hypothetical protein [Rhodoferax sp.]